MKIFFSISLFLLCFFVSFSQEKPAKYLKDLVAELKEDQRGPYHRINWYCDDGSIREPKDPCPDSIKGIQHASFKKEILDLRSTNHIYFGEILAAIEKKESFLDKDTYFSRAKQYQLGKYLEQVDNGWILTKGQFYRGSVQVEDEQEWGRDFLLFAIKDEKLLKEQFLLLKNLVNTIPHDGISDDFQKIRSLSKVLSEEHSSFMDERTKIHGKPESSDIILVERHFSEHSKDMKEKTRATFQELIDLMKSYYSPVDFEKLIVQAKKLKSGKSDELMLSLVAISHSEDARSKVLDLANALYVIRESISSYANSSDRLALFDLSNRLETTILQETQKWNPEFLKDNLDKIAALNCAAYGTGHLESWEYSQIENQMYSIDLNRSISLDQLIKLRVITRRAVEWSASMIKVIYKEVVNEYGSFEPLAHGFIDDQIRSSVALSLGEEQSRLSGLADAKAQISNEVLDGMETSGFRGLNPGYAKGELVVVTENDGEIEIDQDKIYVFRSPPSDLKPVSGIMTVEEGNLVSHVQLLARNLGIPNAALTDKNLQIIKKYEGEVVFYAVSSNGKIIIKKSADMNTSERKLFKEDKKERSVVRVDTDQLCLDENYIVNMRHVDADDSGELCGPKAANLGELKKLFPDQVVEGIIIPFGVFKDHMDQSIPGRSVSYWELLNQTFEKAHAMQKEGSSEQEIEEYQLRSLKELRGLIEGMDLRPGFETQLRQEFLAVFNKKIGVIPVFLRSDTNMEDLEEFTGAGLNLTLFNIRAEDEVLKGIKRVWASPYTERSFKWRQSYLSNPENVFPSILIIPSVDVDYSGVMITKGINEGSEDDLTVAMSRGAGGAVDGQAAETRLITKMSNELLSPARQEDYIRLPESGGTKKYYASFNEAILNEKNIKDLRKLAMTVREKLPANHAYDVEYGFKDDKLWLFQIRPFVESGSARTSEYLNSINEEYDGTLSIPLTHKI